MSRHIDIDAAIPAPTAEVIRELLEQSSCRHLEGRLSVSRLAGGASNENFLIHSDHAELVFRLAATNVSRFGIDRPRGIAAHHRAAQLRIAPAMDVIAESEGHCITRFLPGQVLDHTLLREPGVIELCVKTVSVAHHAEPIHGQFSPFEDIRKYAATCALESLALPDDFTQMANTLDEIEMVFGALAMQSRMCHNDLQIANFIVDGRHAWLLDWEYAGMGNPYFDLSMIVSNGELDGPQQRRLLEAYFGVVRSVDQARMNLMRFVSAVREATWSVVADPVLSSSGTGWDYRAWADQFFGRARALMASTDLPGHLRTAGSSTTDDEAFDRAALLAAETTLSIANGPHHHDYLEE